MTTTVEFAVQISCDSCITKIEKSLEGVKGVKNVQVSRDAGTVVVESDLPSTVIQERIESTGRKAVLKGCGDEGEKEVYMFVKLEKDSDGFCPLCKPDGTVPSGSTKALKDCKSEKNSSLSPKKADAEKKDDINNEKKKHGKNSDGEGDGDDLELKYSSDSEDGDFDRHLTELHTSDGDDIWKMDELDADFDVIDADDDEKDDDHEKSETDEGSKTKNDKKTTASGRKRKHSASNAGSDLGSDDDDCFIKKSWIATVDKNSGKKTNSRALDTKFIDAMKATKIRKGDIDFAGSSYIHLQILIIPENEDEGFTETEAQTIKDCLVQEIFKSSWRLKAGEAGVLMLRFVDCKLIKSGWICVTCYDKETFDWLLNWKATDINVKNFKLIPALDKAPLQDIGFSLKSRWVHHGDTMLKLIHLQNRDIDTKRWVLESKKAIANNMEHFKYKVDFASIRAIKKLDWSFYYELFPVKITEYNGSPVSLLKAAKSGGKLK